MSWVAMREQEIKRDGEYIIVQAGDPIPEAEGWINREPWVELGYIKNIPDIDVGKTENQEVIATATDELSVETKDQEPTTKTVDEEELLVPSVETKVRKRGRPRKNMVG